MILDSATRTEYFEETLNGIDSVSQRLIFHDNDLNFYAISERFHLREPSEILILAQLVELVKIISTSVAVDGEIDFCVSSRIIFHLSSSSNDYFSGHNTC